MTNAARGEAEITLGGETFVCVATMGALARVEKRMGGQPLPQVLEALMQGSYQAGLIVLEETAQEGGERIADLVAGPVEVAEAAAAVFEASGMLGGKPGK